MFKLGGRGGGRGGKRPLPPPPTRPATAPSSARIPLGGGGGGVRGRPGSAPGVGAAATGREESFSLSSTSDLDFGAIIRLTPDLIEEIRRVESQGGSAKIKFAPNSNFPGGNVIDVDGKEFGFTWSRDDLCDIYEECQSGEGGEGLLVERGSAWRKLNVHRILDESTKKHVKKRSEEAERLSKSRKAIILDPSNPAMKNQVKKMAAAGVEGNMRRMGWKQKKEPFFKKQKAETNQGPPKSVYKSGTSSNKPVKGMISVSPIASPHDHPPPRTSLSPFAAGISSRGDANLEEIVAPLDINKEHIDIGYLEKEFPGRTLQGGKHNVKASTSDQPMDLQNSRTRRMSQNSKGMKLKSVEKAVRETSPNLMRKNESILKPSGEPGKYSKPGVELESSTRRAPESESSPESAHDITSAIESIIGEKLTDEDIDHQPQPSLTIGEDPVEKMMEDNPVPLSNSDKKINNDSEGKSSSSESGSDSDSDSSSDSGSDSGSQSGSRSKSRSPVGTASASSSDSESDGPSSSKEGSDVDVDIMTSEDEKEVAKVADLELSSSPRADRASDGEQEQIDIIGDQEEQVVSSPIDLNDFGRNDERALASNNNVKTSDTLDLKPNQSMDPESYRANTGFLVEKIPFSPDEYKQNKDLIDPDELVRKKTANEKRPIPNDWSAYDQTEIIPKVKTKRDSSSEYFKDKLESAKRSKSSRAAEVMPSGTSKEDATGYISPGKARQDQYKSNNNEWSGIRDANDQDHSVHDRSRSVPFANTHRVQQSPEFWNAASADAELPRPRIGDTSGRRKSMDRFSKNTAVPNRPAAMAKNKIVKDVQDEYNVGENLNGPPSQIRNSAKGSVLRRELSDLELGELREAPAGDEIGGVNRQFEGKQSYKSSESKLGHIESSTDASINGRSASHPLLESKKHSTNPLNLRGEVSVNQRIMPSQEQQLLKVDHADSEIKPHLDDSIELTHRGETGTNVGIGFENHSGSCKKTLTSLPLEHDIHVGQKGNRNAKELRQQKPNTLVDSADLSNNSASMGNYINGRKRRESSSEDDTSFYSKYDKEVPELKDRIKDLSQYQDYVQEYREKYDCYVFLNKNLENIRNEFLNAGEKLELTKGRDSEEYYKVVDQLREMYQQYGERNKQMKKVFILLHEELKTLKQRIKEFVETYSKD